MSLNEQQSANEVDPRDDNAKNEWSPEPPTLVQGSGDRWSNQGTNGYARNDNTKLTTDVLFRDSVAPTQGACWSMVFLNEIKCGRIRHVAAYTSAKPMVQITAALAPTKSRASIMTQ